MNRLCDSLLIGITGTYVIISLPIIAIIWMCGGKKPFYHIRLFFERVTK